MNKQLDTVIIRRRHITQVNRIDLNKCLGRTAEHRSVACHGALDGARSGNAAEGKTTGDLRRRSIKFGVREAGKRWTTGDRQRRIRPPASRGEQAKEDLESYEMNNDASVYFHNLFPDFQG
jgi:hypothetical protein